MKFGLTACSFCVIAILIALRICSHMRLAFALLGAASAQKTLSGGTFLEPNSSTANALARGGGNFLYTYTDYATTLKAALLASYDKTVVASSVDRRDDGLDYSGAGTVVKMQVRFFKIDDVDPGTGSMQVKIWLRMRWQDSRLSWEPGQWGNVTELAFNHPKLEEPEIWTPDILPNARLLMADMFEDTVAAVTYDGQVTWSRAGLLDVMCKFSGLMMFPYDSLQCGIDFGGWMLAGHHQDLTLWGEGFTFDNAEDTLARATKSDPADDVSRLVMSYTAVAPSDSDGFTLTDSLVIRWPVIHYHITLFRASSFYTHVLIWPAILITIASFAVFL